jgi:hypothetical protein
MHPQPRVRIGSKYAHENSERAAGITRHFHVGRDGGDIKVIWVF